MKKSSIPPFIAPAMLRGAVCAVCVLGLCGVFAQTITPTPTLNRELIILRPGTGSRDGDTVRLTQALNSSEQPSRHKMITADSARVVSPPPRSVLNSCPVAYEIEPLIPVDSALLYVRHSNGQIDTLATLASPPYRAAWNCAGVPNQDQTHLQFGYVLYCGDTLSIASPPKPHIWALQRGKPAEQLRHYRVKPLAAADGFAVDCDTFKWSGVESAGILGGNTEANFKLLRSGVKLYFIAIVRDNSVSGGDFVELHIDMRRDRADFPGINHRSLRFSPRGRSFFFAGEFVDGKYAQSDSITQLLNDEAEWKASANSNGYVVEAAIPFSALSDLGLPPSKIGLDVSVMDANGLEEAFYSWSGAGQFTRYSPSRWGTARIDNAAPGLKYALIFALFISAFAILGFVVYIFFSHRQESINLKAETTGVSPITEIVVEQIEKQLPNANLGIKDISTSINIPAEKIAEALQNDLGCTFEQQLTYKRIKHSQKLMREQEISMEEIAAHCGFADVNAYRKSYTAQMKAAPEVARKAIIERIREDLEAEAEAEVS